MHLDGLWDNFIPFNLCNAILAAFCLASGSSGADAWANILPNWYCTLEFWIAIICSADNNFQNLLRNCDGNISLIFSHKSFFTHIRRIVTYCLEYPVFSSTTLLDSYLILPNSTPFFLFQFSYVPSRSLINEPVALFFFV